MSRLEKLTWIGATRRWQKRHEGETYTVSCRQLGIRERTEAASRRAAQEWWKDKRLEVDLAKRKPTPQEMGSLISNLAQLVRERAPEQSKDLDYLATALVGTQEEASPQSIAVHVAAWIASQRDKAASGEITCDRADNNRCWLQHFAKFAGEAAPIESINEKTWAGFSSYCRKQVAEKKWSSAYASSVLTVARRFIRSLWESRMIDIPRNLTSRELAIKVHAKKKVFFTPDELKTQIDAAPEPLKLHLLLMANCGFYQSDVADLRHDEVDWERGIIERRRSKTKHLEQTPVVRWRLWPVTFELLKQWRSTHPELALTARNGRPLLVKGLKADGKLSKCDKIMSNYRRLVKVTGIAKPPKSIRKTSANLLESHRDYARFTDYFLGHAEKGIKERHYADSPDAIFFEALDWLQVQYGF